MRNRDFLAAGLLRSLESGRPDSHPIPSDAVPKKARSHDLEEESVDRFKALLPPSLLYRDKPKDYGIDGEVEEFDANGETTGLIFLVQLKGTDEKTRGRRWRTRCPEAT